MHSHIVHNGSRWRYTARCREIMLLQPFDKFAWGFFMFQKHKAEEEIIAEMADPAVASGGNLNAGMVTQRQRASCQYAMLCYAMLASEHARPTADRYAAVAHRNVQTLMQNYALQKL